MTTNEAADAVEPATEHSNLLGRRPKSTSYESLGHGSAFHCHDEEGEETAPGSAKAKRILWISLLICLLFMICEVIGGYWAQSLAIVTDAAHLLTDFASMLISLFALYIAGRPKSRRMSFGFHRAEVLGAFFSVFLIWIVTGILVYLAVLRIINSDYEIDATIMAITAAIGVLVNLVMGALLYFGGHTHSHGGMSHGHAHGGGGHGHGHKGKHSHDHAESGHSHDGGHHDHHHEEDPLLRHKGSVISLVDTKEDAQNINVRAAFIHVIGDLIQSVGVLVAALIIFFFPNWAIMDPICTLIFSIIVLFTTIYILRDALVVLLEGRPSNVDFAAVFTSLERIKGVRKVHDLRIWALTMDKVAISVHLEIDPDARSQSVLKATRAMLKARFGVHESTVQIENYAVEKADCGKCDPPEK